MTEPSFGLFTVDHDARKVRGILVPWDELSRTSATGNRPMKVRPGDLRVPRDPSVVGLNLQHDRFAPIGRLAAAEPVAAGLYAEFDVADTEEGDEWLADHGDLVRLSPELRDIVVGADGYGRATLTGAALVTEGAFASAGLFAIGDVAETDEDETTDTASAEVEEEPDEEPDEAEEGTVAEATVTNTALMSRKPKAQAPQLTKSGFLAAARKARSMGDLAPLKAYAEDAERVGMFALADITFDDANGLVTAAGIPGAWLGELWQGRRFERRVIPLISSGTLTSMKATGWVWDVLPEVDEWEGNKTPIATNEPTVRPVDFAAQRFAGGHDLAREYFDFGVTEVIDSYVQAMVDSYAKKSDAYALAGIVADATPFTPSAATENRGLLAIIDGALTVVAASASPSFALVAPNIFRDVIATPHSDALEYFSAAIGLEEGSTAGFRIVPDARLTAGQVIVGDRNAATAWELPGSPIRVSLPDLVRGGQDQAFYGYIAVGIGHPAALVKATVTL